MADPDEGNKRRLVDVDTPADLLPLFPVDATLLRPGRYRKQDGRLYTIGAIREADGRWYFMTDEEWLSDD